MTFLRFAKTTNEQQATNPTQAALWVCDSEFEAWYDCMDRNIEICSTATTCSNEIIDLDSIDTGSTSCDVAYEGICDETLYTCCAACSDLGAAAINCAASEDGCPQRCGPSGARATSSSGATALAGGILAAMAIIGSVFFA
jgi:hypothetical protein